MDIQLLQGANSRDKLVRIEDTTLDAVLALAGPTEAARGPRDAGR